MIYITGFVDIRYHVFYENRITSHDKNAQNIIETRNWSKEFSEDPIQSITPSDFLIFRKGFAQIGCSGQRTILASLELYKNDTNHSKIWKSIYKALTEQQLDSIITYKLFLIKSL